MRNSGGIDYRLIDEHDGDIVANGIESVALCTLQTRAASFDLERLLADRADENIQQVLGDHLPDFESRSMKCQFPGQSGRGFTPHCNLFSQTHRHTNATAES